MGPLPFTLCRFESGILKEFQIICVPRVKSYPMSVCLANPIVTNLCN